MAYIAQNKKITTGRFHFGVKFPLFKGRDRPQWKVIEWRRRRNIIVDEMCPAYSDRAEIGSLKVQPQFSITTFPEELILSVLLGFSNFFPIQKETIYLLCGNDFCNLILFYLFIYFFGKKDPRLLLSRRFWGLPRCKNLTRFSLFVSFCFAVRYCLKCFCFLCFTSSVSFTGSYTEVKPDFVTETIDWVI